MLTSPMIPATIRSGALLLFTLLALPASAATINLTTNTSGSIQGAFFFKYASTGSGSGATVDFVRFESPGNDTESEGYNTSGRPVEYDENTSSAFTHDIRLNEVPLISYNGVLYRQFGYDSNEPGGNSASLNITDLEIWLSGTGSLTGRGTSFGGQATLAYDFTSNDIVNLADFNQGSGSLDMLLYMPDSIFQQYAQVSGSSNPFIYLYSRTSNETGGFEAWSLAQSAAGFANAPGTAVPLPPIVWLLGSSIIGWLGFTARRAKDLRHGILATH